MNRSQPNPSTMTATPDLRLNTYRAAARFEDGSKIKLEVSDVPDDPETVREIVRTELATFDKRTPTAVLVAMNGGRRDGST